MAPGTTLPAGSVTLPATEPTVGAGGWVVVGLGVGFGVGVGFGADVVGFAVAGFAVVSFGVVGDGDGFDVVGFAVDVGDDDVVGEGFGVVGVGVGVGVGFNASVKFTSEAPLTVTSFCFGVGSTYCIGAAVTSMVVKPAGTSGIE